MSVELYGIGNALVDQEYAIQDDFLSSTGLTKGTMQLAESDAQYALISALNNHTTSAAKSVAVQAQTPFMPSVH